jgi:hypothetical protein
MEMKKMSLDEDEAPTNRFFIEANVISSSSSSSSSDKCQSEKTIRFDTKYLLQSISSFLVHLISNELAVNSPSPSSRDR